MRHAGQDHVGTSLRTLPTICGLVLKKMENLLILMVGVLYIFLIYEIFLCLKQTIIGNDNIKKNCIKPGPSFNSRIQTSKSSFGARKIIAERLASAHVSGRLRPCSSRRFIQMRIVGRRWAKAIKKRKQWRISLTLHTRFADLTAKSERPDWHGISRNNSVHSTV